MGQAAIRNKDDIAQPIVKGLGIRMQKLLIINEKDCFKVKPKGCPTDYSVRITAD
ncbi:MAG: hypothetical protein HMLIMOIP_001304 [Candidatus Nitrosomirales archaeon]|jgi:hypothetical protein